MKPGKQTADQISRRRERGQYASVRDFDWKQLQKALQTDKRGIVDRDPVPRDIIIERFELEETDCMSAISMDVMDPIEWRLTLVDVENTEPQTMEEEFNRLKVLQSYLLLDSDAEDDFDRCTRLASNVFKCPTALVSLIDLGRQWFLSKVGLDATETPRKHAFCAHAILNKYKILIVPDATQDFRFKDNPLVTGPPHIRFYAGAALVSPEGYKLGTLCIIDNKPRPEGLNTTEQEMLHDMAAIVVKNMVVRRSRLKEAENEVALQDMGKSLIKSYMSLSGSIQKVASFVLRNSSEESTLPENDVHILTGVVHDLEVHASICTAVARSIVDVDDTTSSRKAEVADLLFDKQLKSFSKQLQGILDPVTDMTKLFGLLKGLVKPIPHGATVTLELTENVHRSVTGEDLLLFRSVLNLLLHGISRAPSGYVHLRISMRDDNYLVFECADTGTIIPRDVAKGLFDEEDSLLAPIGTVVRTLRGSFGMRLGSLDQNRRISQAIFWFHIPACSPDENLFPDYVELTVGETLREVFEPTPPTVHVEKLPPDGTVLSADLFKAAWTESGCVSLRSLMQ